MTSVQAGSRPIRVLHLRDSPWVDGPGRTILETATRIDRSRVEYYVGAFVSDPDVPHPLVEALRARHLPVYPITDRGGVGREIVDRLLELIDALQVDVLHTSEFRSNVLALLCRRRRPRLRLVSTAHGWIANDLRGKASNLVDRVLLRQFDRVILVSNAMRRRLPKWWVSDARVRLLHNALTTDSYGRDVLDAPRRIADSLGEIRVLNVGRLSPEKGQSLLIEALAELVPEFPGLQLWFAGIGPQEQQLRSATDRFGVSDCVRFLGYVSDMPALYGEVDLVVQSSLTEGLPNVMLEAAYLGVPVIATDVGGTSEVIEHGLSGMLIERGSAAAIVGALRCFLSRPQDFVQMAQHGRFRVETGFSMEARTNRQTEMYEEIACDEA